MRSVISQNLLILSSLLSHGVGFFLVLARTHFLCLVFVLYQLLGVLNEYRILCGPYMILYGNCLRKKKASLKREALEFFKTSDAAFLRRRHFFRRTKALQNDHPRSTVLLQSQTPKTTVLSHD